MSPIAWTTDCDYAYDFPIPSTSAPPSPPHKSRRLSHHSRHAELTRMLDPAYAPPSSSSTSPVDAYLDHHGDLHDPDYIHFPAVRVRVPHPRWDVPPDDDDDADEPDTLFHTAFFPKPSYRAFPPIPHAAYSPPTSFDSDDAVLEVQEEPESPFVDREKEQQRWLCPVSRYTSRRRSREEERPTVDEKPDDETELTRRKRSTDFEPEWTPTCSESLRRQWQRISLRFRLGLFRAQRRARRRLSGT